MQIKNDLISIYGLFFPIITDEPKKRIVFTIAIGRVPIGWIMIAVAIIIKHLPL
jgi:uncharacterized membrane protein